MDNINKKIIPVFFTFDNNFIVPAIVAIYSLLKYADKTYFYKLYIVHSDLTNSSKRKLNNLINKFEENSSINFIEVDNYVSDWTNIKHKHHYSKEIYNKLIAEKLFPQYDMILCSDVDVIFQGDISKSYISFDCNENFYIAGINSIFNPELVFFDLYSEFDNKDKDIIINHGVGAGYLLLNLKKMRENNICNKMISLYKENLNRLVQPEQDVFNLCCYPYIKYLPYKYLICVSDYVDFKKNRQIKISPSYSFLEFKEALMSPVQLHYAGLIKPWNSFFSFKQYLWFKELIGSGYFLEYLKKLPYFLHRRSKNYSLKRFFRKIYRRIIS